MRNFLWFVKEAAIMFVLTSMVLFSAAIGALILLSNM